MTSAIVDILPTLPHEIYDQIFYHLSESELWRLGHVCKSWRAMVLHWQPRWECLSTTKDGRHSIIPDMVPYTPYIQKGSVKQIRVHTDDLWQLFQVVSFVKNQGFYAISTLDIFVEYFTTTDLDSLVITCGNSLKNIIIKGLDTHEANVRPETLLIACPNLVKLHFEGMVCTEEENQWKPDFGIAKCNELIDLTLYFTNEKDFDNFNPRPFLQTAPNLRYLTMSAEHLVTACNDLPNWIQEYCPDLTTLAFDHQLWSSDGQLAPIASKFLNHNDCPILSSSSSTEMGHHQNRKGVQHISIHKYDYNEVHGRAIRHIISPFLEIDRSQLVTLDFGGNTMVNNSMLTFLASKPWPSLKGLRLFGFNGGAHGGPLNSSLLVPLFQPDMLPNLTYFSFCFPETENKDVFDAIATNLVHLEELALYASELNKDELLQFLGQLGQKKRQEYHLRTLKLFSAISPSIASEVMNILGSGPAFVEYLDHLTVDGINYTELGFAGIENLLDSRQEAISNNRGKKFQKLNLALQPHWRLPEEIPLSNTRVKHLLAKIDQNAIEWEYCIGLAEEEDDIENMDSRIVEEVTHVQYRSRQANEEEYDYTKLFLHKQKKSLQYLNVIYR